MPTVQVYPNSPYAYNVPGVAPAPPAVTHEGFVSPPVGRNVGVHMLSAAPMGFVYRDLNRTLSPEQHAYAMALIQAMRGGRGSGGGGGGGSRAAAAPSQAPAAPPMAVSHTPFTASAATPTAPLMAASHAPYTPPPPMASSHESQAQTPPRQYIWSAPDPFTDPWGYAQFQMQNLNPLELYQRALGRPTQDYVWPWLRDTALPWTGGALYESMMSPFIR